MEQVLLTVIAALVTGFASWVFGLVMGARIGVRHAAQKSSVMMHEFGIDLVQNIAKEMPENLRSEFDKAVWSAGKAAERDFKAKAHLYS